MAVPCPPPRHKSSHFLFAAGGASIGLTGGHLERVQALASVKCCREPLHARLILFWGLVSAGWKHEGGVAGQSHGRTCSGPEPSELPGACSRARAQRSARCDQRLSFLPLQTNPRANQRVEGDTASIHGWDLTMGVVGLVTWPRFGDLRAGDPQILSAGAGSYEGPPSEHACVPTRAFCRQLQGFGQKSPSASPRRRALLLSFQRGAERSVCDISSEHRHRRFSKC